MSTFTLTDSKAAVVSAALRCYADECRGNSLLYEPKAEWRRIERQARELAEDIENAMGGE